MLRALIPVDYLLCELGSANRTEIFLSLEELHVIRFVRSCFPSRSRNQCPSFRRRGWLHAILGSR